MGMRKVLMIRFSSLGDILLTLPAVTRIWQKRDVDVHYLTKESYRTLLEMSGVVSQIHTVPDNATFLQLVARLRQIKRVGFDSVYDLHANLRSTVACAVLDPRAFFDGRRVRKFRLHEAVLFCFRRQLYNSVVGLDLDRRREAERVLSRERADGAPGSQAGAAPLLRHVPDLPDELVRRIGDGARDYVCVCAESAWRQKEWPFERFLETARALSSRGEKIVWMGLRPVPQGALDGGMVDLTGRTDLAQAAAVLQRARVLVCNDSGLMHLAEAVGTPVVALFGPTSREAGFAPALPASRIVEAGLWCRPCSKTGCWCFRPVARRKCLMEIPAKRTEAATLSVLERRSPPLEKRA